MIDENLMITAASAGFKNLTGYEKSEIEGILRWDDFILEEDAGRLTEHLLLISQGRYLLWNRSHSVLLRKITG